MSTLLMLAMCSCQDEFDLYKNKIIKKPGYWTDEESKMLIYIDSSFNVGFYYDGIEGFIEGIMGGEGGDNEGDVWSSFWNGNSYTIHDVYNENEMRISFTYENDIWGKYIGKEVSLPPTKIHRVNVEKDNNKIKIIAQQGFEGGFGDMALEVNGVTADGCSRLAIIVNDPDLINLSAFSDKECKLNPKYSPKYGLCIEYIAPNSCSINGEPQKITLLGTGKTGLKIYEAPPVYIYKMGVGLIHGLGDNAENCFGGLQEYLTNYDYIKEQVQLIDYSKSNKSSFNTNVAKNIVGENLEKIYTNLLDKGIVSSKYALVGHSMGGILSRLYAQEQNSAGVGAIITLDTPHYGSQLADIGGGIVVAVEYAIDKIAKGAVAGFTGNPILIGMSGKAISLLFDHIYRNSALYDLRTDSEAIMDMNNSTANLNNIPVHAICSYMVGYGATEAPEIITFINRQPKLKLIEATAFFSKEISKDKYEKLYKDASSEISQQILNVIYGESEHDGVVSGESQRGGLDPNFYCTIERDAYKGPLGFLSNAHHCKTNRWEHTYENIFDLLQSPFTDKRFCTTGNGFKARSNSRSTETDSNYEYSFTDDVNTYVKLKTCALEEMDDTRCIHVNLDKSENIIADMVLITFGEEEVNVDICRNDYYLEIPEDYKGEAQIAVFGKTENNELTVDYKTYIIN